MSPQELKILVIYENGAGGHRGCALAIAEAINEHPGVTASALELDTLAPKSRKKMYNAFMDIRVHFRRLVRFGFQFALIPNPIFSLYRRFESLMQPYSLRRFLDVVARDAPDLIISTHFRPNVACSTWVERGTITAPVHSACVDYVAHGMYARRGISRYYVATEEVKADLVRQGVPAANIDVTGIAVSPKMTRPEPRGKTELRTALGIAPELPMILVMGGARGDQDYDAILRELGSRNAKIQAVVLCGWNEELKAHVESIARDMKIPVHVKGFQSNMAEWYRAADLVLTKPGGMTSSEVLVMGNPMVILSPCPGKEEVQAERLARAGVAIYEKTPQAAVSAALRVLTDPVEQARVKAAVERVRRPDAGQKIATALIAAARAAREKNAQRPETRKSSAPIADAFVGS